MGRRVLVIISIIILILALGFMGYKLFRVRDISIDGCETLSPDDIIALSGITYDQHLLEINMQKAVEQIEEDPFVETASIDIVYPDTIAITVQERKPAAYVAVESTVIIIDADGYVLEVGVLTDTGGYPQVTGLQISDFVIGQRIGAQDEFRLDVLSRVLEQTTTFGIEVTVVDVTRTADIKLHLADGLTVELGDDMQLEKKLSLTISAREALPEQADSGGILDVASAKTAYYREK